MSLLSSSTASIMLERFKQSFCIANLDLPPAKGPGPQTSGSKPAAIVGPLDAERWWLIGDHIGVRFVQRLIDSRPARCDSLSQKYCVREVRSGGWIAARLQRKYSPCRKPGVFSLYRRIGFSARTVVPRSAALASAIQPKMPPETSAWFARPRGWRGSSLVANFRARFDQNDQ